MVRSWRVPSLADLCYLYWIPYSTKSLFALGGHNHGEDWAKTAVEMSIMRREARGGKAKNLKELGAMGFGSKDADGKKGEEKKERIFF